MKAVVMFTSQYIMSLTNSSSLGAYEWVNLAHPSKI